MMDLVSYDERHNEENGELNQDGPEWNLSWNCGVEGPTRKKKVLELRGRQIRNAFLMVLLAEGTPMIQAGDEFGNSQGGNNNPYCLDNEVSWVDWKAARKNKELTDFVRDVLAFRKRHKILHMDHELRIMDTLSCGYPDLSYHSARAWYGEFQGRTREVGMMYCEKYAGEDSFLYVAYNLNPEKKTFALPHLPEGMSWHVAIDSGEGVYPEGEELPYTDEKTLDVAERTIIVLIGRR
jgi:glycogen operon protein